MNEFEESKIENEAKSLADGIVPSLSMVLLKRVGGVARPSVAAFGFD